MDKLFRALATSKSDETAREWAKTIPSVAIQFINACMSLHLI